MSWCDTKPDDGEAPILQLWGMSNILSLPLILGPLWPGVLVSVRISHMRQTEIIYYLRYVKPFNSEQTNDWC